ncbi:restriction endonuclease [Burkholderia pseudomallei]|uniref:restriction endonuclease n=1 Tax=Burkholderia pseudomallei TaxID=28450 RepID=UPI0011AB550A|nr:restriction endonuclease [Burkholderia pseudomallei]
MDSLPYEKLSWQLFESLCAHLLNESPELKVKQAFRYGREGQDQGGIDIIATSADGAGFTVTECKRYRDISKSMFGDWIKKFLSGRWAGRSQKYILCVATAVSDTKLTDVWLEMSRRFHDVGIDAELWDAVEIDRRLRKLPGLVTQFFGRQYAERFCSNARRDEAYPSRFRTRFENLSEPGLLLENESIAVSFNLPNERFPNFGAIFSFARSDLSGISFSVSGDLLVRWLQWRAWSPVNSTRRPYADPSTWAPGKFVLATHSTRLTLTQEEVEHLDWIFASAWPHFLSAAYALETRWRYLRFKRLEHSEAYFSIASLRKRDWAAMLAFANEHDCARGTSEKHIFDYSQGMLKVYVEHQCHGLNRGYHVILRAFDDGGMTGLWDGSLDLAWEPLSDISSEPVKLGPSDAWDAEYTHDWVLNKLCKWVEEWVATQRTEETHAQARWFRLFRRKQSIPKLFNLDVTSAACLPKHGIGVARTTEELAEEVSYYQIHFHRRDAAPVHMQMIESVLKLVRRHLPLVDDGDRRYIASKLHLDDALLEEGIDDLLADNGKLLSWPGDLDLALRCLVQIFRITSGLTSSELDYATHLLKPLADRVREDLVCNVFARI